MPILKHPLPDIDWDLYGSVCFAHRAAVIKALTHPLQPCDIKRKLRRDQPELRISADNVGAVIRAFRLQGIVRVIKAKKGPYVSYILSSQGQLFRELLIQAEVRI